MTETRTVTLRTRPTKKGLLSFYLDFYPFFRDVETMKAIRHLSLGIYIYAKPKNQRELEYNARMTEKAEIARCRYYEAIINERYGILDTNKYKGDFLAYYREQTFKHNRKWDVVYQHFRNFCHGKCTFGDIDVELCRKFHDYLLRAKQLNRRGCISHNSAAGYWSTFRGFLRALYRDGKIRTNVNDYLDRIKEVDIVKDYLNVDELHKLANTPCDRPVVKTAALFSCLSGLRLSDILSLRWDDIVDFAAGGKCVHIVTVKTKTEDIIPISEEALELIDYSPEKKGLVFAGMQRCWTQSVMKKWISSAGITKNITFHSFRRTFATLQAAAGTDIRTIQSMMAHRCITTTQRYMKVVDSNKREASNKISLRKKN